MPRGSSVLCVYCDEWKDVNDMSRVMMSNGVCKGCDGEIMECEDCGRACTELEAEHRNFNRYRCSYCNGTLKKKPDLPSQETGPI